MKKEKEKYESPFMERTLVELESNFCVAASGEKIVKEKNTKVSIDRQDGFKENDIIIDSWN